MNKKLVPSLLIGFFVSIMAAVGYIQIIKAEVISGWLWSGTQESASNNTGFGWASVNSADTASPVSYNLDIPLADGPVVGYVWSENIGWIDFNPVGPFPDSPQYSVQRNSDNLVGWARITGIADEIAFSNSGGWEGWIKMSGSTQSGAPFGVNLADLANSYAWSDELGWISFENIILPSVPQLKVCLDTGSDLFIAKTPSVGTDPLFNDTNIDLGAYYSNNFFQLDCANKTASGVTNVDSPATWSSSNSGSLIVDGNGQVGPTSSANAGDTAVISAEYLALDDSVTVCVYDCSTCQASTYLGQTCNGGCPGIDCAGKRSKGEYWVEE